MPFGPLEMLVVSVIALLVFGKDLPNVAREWGKAFNEFRRHLNSVKSDLNDAIYAEPDRPRLQHHPEFHNREEQATILESPAQAELAPADAAPSLAADALPSD